jgi:hypothetical protein
MEGICLALTNARGSAGSLPRSATQKFRERGSRAVLCSPICESVVARDCRISLQADGLDFARGFI